MHGAYIYAWCIHAHAPAATREGSWDLCVLSRGLETILGPIVAMRVLKSEPPFPPRVPYENELNAAWVAYQVASDGIRPPMPDGAPPSVKQLITACWAQKARLRPSFGAICDTLAAEVE